MAHDTRNERHSPSPKQHRNSDQTEVLRQDAGAQRQDQHLVTPISKGRGDQGAVHRGRIDGWVAQPSADPARRTLCKIGPGVNVEESVRDAGTLGTQQTGHHPGKGVGVALIGPEAGLEVVQDRQVQSGSVPGGISGSHRQKVFPTGDAFSYLLSGRQVTCSAADTS